MSARLRAIRVVHPFPSILNALLVFGLVLAADGSWQAAAALALAMLGLQFSIGATNDLFDEDLDRGTKPGKPIPAGLIGRPAAAAIALLTGGGGLAVAASFGRVTLLMAAVMLGAGLAYDAFLKRGPWGWTAFAVAFPILPLYAWYGATAALPPRWELLIPVAALAGPALQLANGLVDLERDRTAGVTALAGRLGRRASLAVIACLLLVIHALAWVTLLLAGDAQPATLVAVTLAGALAAAGLLLSASPRPELRERGWQAQAASIALLALGWLAAAAAAAGSAG